MSRLTRFILSQIVWIFAAGWLMLNADWIGFQPPNEGLIIISLAVGFTLFINLLIWFREGLFSAFRDSTYADEREYQAHRESNTPAIDSTEKRKRDRIDAVLRDLSDDDLVRLRERLATGHIDDDLLYDRMVGDGGELVRPMQK
ncbi:MAG: hypothetical protein AAFQ07_02935 [Chloroflexota bacterium]